MDLFLPILAQVPLFAGIHSSDLEKLLNCLNAHIRRYEKDEVILLAGQPASRIGIVLNGMVQVMQEDADGNVSLLTKAAPGELFAEAFACAGKREQEMKLPVSVVSDTASEIMLLDYRRIVTSCTSACAFHTRLIENMLAVLATKTIQLNRKLGYLSKRTTREKLLAFLTDQASGHGRDSFRIPFDRQGLANYLCVDRSAMSAALGRLREEGILAFHKNEFRML